MLQKIVRWCHEEVTSAYKDAEKTQTTEAVSSEYLCDQNSVYLVEGSESILDGLLLTQLGRSFPLVGQYFLFSGTQDI